jgi:APA family basic amino acid/polyamine antiporter
MWHILNRVTLKNPQGLFIPPNLGVGQFGWDGIVRASGVVFFAYIGFDAVSTAAQESKIPNATCRLEFSDHWPSAPCFIF